MRRCMFDKRTNFIQRHHDIGFTYWDLPSRQGKPYWQEGVVYEFDEREIDLINDATDELYQMCLAVVDKIVRSGNYPEAFGLDNFAKGLIEASWRSGEPSIYGRFDLAYDGKMLKMLEFNGDTPTGLLEGSVAQWYYIQEAHAIPDELRHQNNDLHERLIAHWQRLYPPDSLVHFTTGKHFPDEDWGNLIYMMDTALEAGLQVKEICLEDIGLDGQGRFVDLEGLVIERIFKLYPWEWLVQDDFAKFIPTAQTKWLEPTWKMLLSNKAMLVAMWQMFKNHPFLLEAHATPDKLDGGRWCQKAILGREGLNIYAYDGTTKRATLAQGSVLDKTLSRSIYQRWVDLPCVDGFYPVIGSWVIGEQASGMAVREDPNLVTGDDAHFACHVYMPQAGDL